VKDEMSGIIRNQNTWLLIYCLLKNPYSLIRKFLPHNNFYPSARFLEKNLLVNLALNITVRCTLI